jgi:hypothetical protein
MARRRSRTWRASTAVTTTTFYRWKRSFGTRGVQIAEARRVKELETEPYLPIWREAATAWKCKSSGRRLGPRVMVNSTSSPFNRTCIIEAGERPSFKHSSFVYYARGGRVV